MLKRKVPTKRQVRENNKKKLVGGFFLLFTVSFFLLTFLLTSDRWGTINTEIRSFAAAGKKKPTPIQKKKAAKVCTQHCAGCGGFCADGENETCNALAAERCGEKPCYAAGPDGKSYICTKLPAASAPKEKPAITTSSSTCDGESSSCSCDPKPVCNTVLRDRFHSSCPEYCTSFTKTHTTPTAEGTQPNAKSALDSLRVHSTLVTTQAESVKNSLPATVTKRPEKFGDRCSVSKKDCGEGLSCLATPYGYYCGVPDMAYKSVKNGDECGSIVQCSNACASGFYRTPSGDFFCGKPPSVVPVGTSISPHVTLSVATSVTLRPTKTITPTMPKKSPTITRSITTTSASVSRQDCTNPILPYAAVGGHGGDILPSTYAPKDLVSVSAVNKAYAVNPSTKISASAVEPLNDYAAYVQSQGYTMVINSEGGYRSHEKQQQLHDNFYKTHSIEEYPNGSGAPVSGGHSQHQTGLAVDIGFLDKNGARAPNVNPDIVRIVNKAPEYGIVQPVSGDTAHFYVLEPVVPKEKWKSDYRPIAKNAADMDALNAMIKQQKEQCKK